MKPHSGDYGKFVYMFLELIGQTASAHMNTLWSGRLFFGCVLAENMPLTLLFGDKSDSQVFQTLAWHCGDMFSIFYLFI